MSQIIGIASGKGGVGKTWLTISLAHTLARRGRRVLLFDGDLGLANVDIQLGLDQGTDLSTVLAGRCRLADAIRSLDALDFDVLPGRSGSGDLAQLEPERLTALLADLRGLARSYDVTLLDLPAGIDHIVRSLLAAATHPLVVTTDEPTALTDAYALIKTSQKDGHCGVPGLIINLAASHEAGRQTYRGLLRVCQRFLQIEPPLAGILRRDPRVPDAIRHQTSFMLRHPMSPAAKDIEALARQLAVDV